MVGGRDSEYAIEFMDDLRDRLANRVQLTTDGHKAYLEAVEGAFGGDVDYALISTSYVERQNLWVTRSLASCRSPAYARHKRSLNKHSDE